MSVRIYALERGGLNNPVRGCCCFDYRGHTISVSTIAQPEEILVFHTETKEDLCTIYASAEGVAEAMTRIDEEVRKVEEEYDRAFS